MVVDYLGLCVAACFLLGGVGLTLLFKKARRAPHVRGKVLYWAQYCALMGVMAAVVFAFLVYRGIPL